MDVFRYLVFTISLVYDSYVHKMVSQETYKVMIIVAIIIGIIYIEKDSSKVVKTWDVPTKELLWKITKVSESIKDKYLDEMRVSIFQKSMVLEWENTNVDLTIENTEQIMHGRTETFYLGIGIEGCLGVTLYWYEFTMRNPFWEQNTGEKTPIKVYLPINKDLSCHKDEILVFVRISTFPSPSFDIAENRQGYDTYYNDVAEGDKSTLDDRLCLKTTRALRNLSKNLKCLYLKDKDPDVMIKVRNGNLKAHRTILKARSPVLAAMLKQEMSEIPEDEYDSEDFAIFLLFLYTGTADNLTTENVISVYKIADKYQVLDLRETCAGYLVSNINVNSVSNVIRVALKHKDSKLQDYATDFFLMNAGKVVSTTEWQAFLTENPIVANELVIKSYSYKMS